MYLSLFTTLFLALAAQSAPLPKSAQASLAPLYRRSDNPTRFIVALHPNSVNPTNRLNWINNVLGSSSVSAQSVGDDEGGVVHHWDENVFNGFAGTFDDASLTTLRAQSEVAYVEEDVVLHKTATAAVTQTNSPWGIARLSSSTPLSVARNFDPNNVTFSYTFPTSAGSNVDIYILDSGIRTTHSDFGGRATFLATFNGGVQGDDRDGHGTHVAGTAAGSFFGVAKKANLFAVKVLDDQGAGPISGIISGLNLVAQRVANQTSSTNDTGIRPIFQSVESPAQVSNQTANANNFTLLNQLPTTLNSSTPLDPTASRAVVNMSLGGDSHSNALDAAVQSLVAQGVVVVIAAGNSGVTVGTSSPADVDTAIVVGAMDVHDTVPSFSDFGSNVAVFAPGVDIISCGITSDTATQVLSGTSMSTPHITGLSALILADDPTLTPAEVKAKIQSLALTNALGSGFPTGTGTSNLLAQNGLSL